MDTKYIKAFKQLIIAALLLLLFAMNTHAQTNQTWYQDADGDGFGNPSVSITSATQPVGYVLNRLDCDDNKVTPLTSINVGQPDFTAGLSFYSSIVMDSAGTIYAAYQDGGNGRKASVMKYNGINWTQVGSAGFTSDTAMQISMALDPSGLPYIAYADYTYGNGNGPARLSVMRFDGSSWVGVGTPGFSTDSSTGKTSIMIDQAGTPYVAYMHSGYQVDIPGIWTYNGTTWVRLNTAGLPTNGTSAIQLALDNVGIPWIAYPDWANSGKLSVEKYTGSGWAVVGSALSNGAGASLVFKFNGGVPYVFYGDGATGYKANVKKFDGTNWVSIGAADFASPLNYASMAVDNGGTPWVIINPNNASLILMKFNGTSWVTVSDTLYNSGLGSVFEVDILIDKSGIPNIVYRTTKLTVKKIAPKLAVSSISISASATNVTGGTSVTYTASAVNGGSSPAYQWYKNGVAIPGATAATYTTTNSNNKDTITCKLVSSDPCTVSTPASSTPVIMKVQKYFRTVKTGVYNDITAWQGSPDSITWAPAYGIPDKGVTSIEIRNVIYDTRSSNATVPDFTISAAGEYHAPDLLSVYGNLVNNATIYTYDTIAFVNRSTKTISGTHPISFTNINMTDSSSVNILSFEYVTGLISFGTNAILNTGNQIALISRTDRTAGVGTLPAGADVIGKVWYQRNIPGGSSHRKWRFLAMPIQGQTFANSWQNSIYITGPGTGGRDCGTTGNMVPNSAGFDQNQTGMNHPTDTALTSTIFSWDEQSNAWRGIPSTSTAIDPTVGYRVFVRGDRNQEGCALLTVMPDSVSPVTLMGLGEIVKGTITKNLTYTAGKGEGWNLLSNPYPCPVSWNSLYNNNSANLDATISIMNPIDGRYAYYSGLAGTGTNGGSNQIGSGQSFFVQAYDNTTFNFTEQDKSYNPNSGLFGKAAPSLLKIRLAGPDMDDEAVILQSGDATYHFDKKMDGEKRTPDVAISDVVIQAPTEDVETFIASGTNQTSKLLVFNFIPFTQQSDTLPLFVKMNENTSYTFSFPELTINETYHLWLHDKYTNSYTDIRKHNSINVTTLTDAISHSDNRFELLIVNSVNVNDLVTTGVNETMQQAQGRMIVYPVPASEVLNIQLNNVSSGKATIGIYDITGKEVLANNFTLGQSNETVALSLNNMAPGAYFIKAVVNGQPLPAQKFIKN